MTQKIAEPDHTAMEGGGFYNKNSALQASGISLLMPIWVKVCQTVDCVGEPFVIVDYASSQGRNSMLPIRLAIETIRHRKTSNSPVEVFHTDLASNDFSALFHAIQDDASSYMVGLSNVFPVAIGRNYFQPLFAKGRVHLGWNTFSMQWLGKNPIDPSDHVISGLSQIEDVMTSVEQQQAQDWKRFLEVRSHEMRPGAKLLTAFTGKFEGVSGWEWLCGELWATLKDMKQAGLLSGEELRRLTIPIGFRTADEIRAPFDANKRFAELSLEHVEYFKIADPFWSEYQDTKDQNLLAQRHADLTRAWAGPTLMGHIEPTSDRSAVIENLFERFTKRIASNPKKHEPWMAVAVLEKV